MPRSSTNSTWRRRVGLDRPPVGHHGTAPHDDLAPGDATAHTTLLIAATPRSGSNLLCSLLSSTGVAGRPTEYLQPAVLGLFAERWGVPKARPKAVLGQTRRLLNGRDRWWVHRWWRGDSVAEYIELLVGHRTSPNGVFAIKVFPAQLRLLRQTWGLDLDVFPGELKLVHLRRDDVVGQAISYFRASNTDEWIVVDRPRGIEPPEYDADAILERICFFDAANESWRQEFQRLGVEPLEIDYSELTADPEGTVHRVLALIGEVPVGSIATGTKRQADHRSDDMRQRFLADHPEFAARSIPS